MFQVKKNTRSRQAIKAATKIPAENFDTRFLHIRYDMHEMSILCLKLVWLINKIIINFLCWNFFFWQKLPLITSRICIQSYQYWNNQIWQVKWHKIHVISYVWDKASFETFSYHSQGIWADSWDFHYFKLAEIQLH